MRIQETYIVTKEGKIDKSDKSAELLANYRQINKIKDILLVPNPHIRKQLIIQFDKKIIDYLYQHKCVQNYIKQNAYRQVHLNLFPETIISLGEEYRVKLKTIKKAISPVVLILEIVENGVINEELLLNKKLSNILKTTANEIGVLYMIDDMSLKITEEDKCNLNIQGEKYGFKVESIVTYLNKNEVGEYIRGIKIDLNLVRSLLNTDKYIDKVINILKSCKKHIKGKIIVFEGIENLEIEQKLINKLKKAGLLGSKAEELEILIEFQGYLYDKPKLACEENDND